MESLVEVWVGWVDSKPEQMALSGCSFGGELDSGEKRHASGKCYLAGFRDSCRGVVVGDGEQGDSLSVGRFHELRRGESSI